MSGASGRQAAAWVGALLAGIGVTVGLWLLDIPSPTLFGGLVTGGIVALRLANPPSMPMTANRLAQAVIGVMIGTTITVSALRDLATNWFAVLVVTLATLGLSLLCGLILARWAGMPQITGLLAMIAGGASAITATARELGADDRVVAIVQYLRVLIILFTLPVVALLLFHAGSAPAAATPRTTWWLDLVFTVGCVVAGWVIARLLPATTMYLFGPMAVSGGLVLSGWLPAVRIPVLIAAACFIGLGLQVGLRFTRESLRAIARMLPAAAILILALAGACGGLALLLVVTSDVSGLTAYLGTTPGGLPAVLALAAGSDADATYVFALQLARLLLVLAIAPLLSTYYRRRPAT